MGRTEAGTTEALPRAVEEWSAALLAGHQGHCSEGYLLGAAETLKAALGKGSASQDVFIAGLQIFHTAVELAKRVQQCTQKRMPGLPAGADDVCLSPSTASASTTMSSDALTDIGLDSMSLLASAPVAAASAAAAAYATSSSQLLHLTKQGYRSSGQAQQQQPDHQHQRIASKAAQGAEPYSGPESYTPAGLYGTDGSPAALYSASIVNDVSAMQLLYDRLGGWELLGAAVQQMYSRLFQDPRTARFFHATNRSQLMRHMTAFMSATLSGKIPYTPRQIWMLHRRMIIDMGLREEHVDIMSAQLQEVLRGLGASDVVVQEAMDCLHQVRHVFQPDEPAKSNLRVGSKASSQQQQQQGGGGSSSSSSSTKQQQQQQQGSGCPFHCTSSATPAAPPPPSCPYSATTLKRHAN